MIRDRFSRATSAVLLDFRGLSVAKTTELRNQFRKAGVDFRVVKNSLVKIAIKDTAARQRRVQEGARGRDRDRVDATRTRRSRPSWSRSSARTRRSRSKLTIKCGVLENQVMPGERVESVLATLPGKNEVRAMLLAQLLAPAQKLVMQLPAPGQNLAFVLDARRRQLEEVRQ